MASQPMVAGQSTLPPAYSEKQDLATDVQPPPALPPGGNQPVGYVYPQGSVPQAWPQGYPMPQTNFQMHYPAVQQKPNYPGPHTFFMFALVTTIICGILNLLSLAFGIPAVVLAALSMNAKSSKDYPGAKRHGRNALILTIINIFFTLLLALLITGLTVGFECAQLRYYSYYSYSSYYYHCGRYYY